MSLLRSFSFRVRGTSRATGCPRSVMRMTFPALALATHSLARCRSSRIPIFSTIATVAHYVLHMEPYRSVVAFRTKPRVRCAAGHHKGAVATKRPIVLVEYVAVRKWTAAHLRLPLQTVRADILGLPPAT